MEEDEEPIVFSMRPLSGCRKQFQGLKFLIENEHIKPSMKVSSENGFLVRGGMVFSGVRARIICLDLWALRELSGPLNRLNATLSLLHHLDRYRTPSAIGSAIGRPLSRPISLPNTGGSPQPPRSKPLGGLNRAIVVL